MKLGRITLAAPSAQGGAATDGIGDGVLVVAGLGTVNSATIASSAFEGCDRAGILLANSAGSIDDSRASANRFGLVTQGSPRPSVGAGDVFEHNTEKDRLENGMLPVPGFATSP